VTTRLRSVRAVRPDVAGPDVIETGDERATNLVARTFASCDLEEATD
jgi:hypothetical protein